MFEAIYSFRSDEQYLVEVKRIDAPQGASKSDVFFWLFWSGNNNTVQRLDFVSMEQKEGQQMRTFRQAQLRFNMEEAHLSPDSGPSITLRAAPLSQACEAAVTRFLEAQVF